MGKKIKILIAEEDEKFIQMIISSLQASGASYEIKKAASGQECLQMLQEEKFDLLLLDHSLPDGPGLSYLKKINRSGLATPTVFITAKGDPFLALEAMREGVFDYINRSAECAKAFPFVLHRALEGYNLMVEKVRLQSELIATKNFLESVIEKAGDAISVVDLEGKILYWNEGAERIYGFGKDEALGQKFSDLLYPFDEKARREEENLHHTFMEKIKRGEVVSHVERKIKSKDGREIITSMTISPLRDSEGQITGASRICRDITTLKKAEERLLLAARLSSLGELSAGVAHELRNPLSGIKINMQILARQKDLAEAERRLLKSTQEGIDKIQKIIDDMLNFARPKPANFKPENINDVISHSIAIIQDKFKRANISLIFSKEENLPGLFIDAHQIQQVLINLMLNAQQAMEKGGTLTIRSAHHENGGVKITIKDTGSGIPKEHLHKIFDPFFTTKSEGTGLGLSISLKILENHGATLEVQSEVGSGSVFTINFPPERTCEV